MKYIFILLALLSLTCLAQNIPSFDIKHKASLMAECQKKCTSQTCRQKCQQQYGQGASIVSIEASKPTVAPKEKNSHSYCMKRCGCLGKKCTLKKKKICYNRCRK